MMFSFEIGHSCTQHSFVDVVVAAAAADVVATAVAAVDFVFVAAFAV